MYTTSVWYVHYKILIYFLFPAKLPTDKLKHGGSLLSLQEKSQDSTLERLKGPMQEFLNRQDAVPKVGIFWLTS
jgi:hypothetical protein